MHTKPTIKQILADNRSLWDNAQTTPSVRENFQKVLDCRTFALGAEVYASDNGERKSFPHTCKSRACSSCGQRTTLAWQREVAAMLPDIPFAGVCLTMHADFWPIFQQNRRLLDDLPAIGAGVLQDWAEEKYGARVIIVVVRHTFGSHLNFNAHLHILVSTVGLHKTESRLVEDIRFPRDAVMRNWRHTLLDYLTMALEAGQLASHTDVNTQTTTYSYESYLNRIASIVLPSTTDGTFQSAGGTKTSGQTIYTYTDTPEAFSVQEQNLVDSGGTTTSVTKTYDGLGRVIQTATAVPTTQCSGGTLFTQTTYDSMSRVYSVSNPYCSTSDPTYGLTYFEYDGLGRKIQTTLPDGAVSTIAYAGNATETTDPPNGTTSVQHIQQSNGLGFLTSVCEVGLAPQSTGGPQDCKLNIAGSGSLTTYAYDPLGNMLSVNQHGLGRTFTYDGLSRLTSALNPEVGTDYYTYLNTNAPVPSPGNVSSPITRTDARGVITTYTYDSMSRLTSKAYSAASGNTTGGVSDLTSCYQYGLTSDPSNNTGGRLIAEWQQAGTCASSIPTTASAITVRKHPIYDAMGRLLIDQQCLTGATCSSTTGYFVYSYNLLGNPVQSNNGIFAAQVPATQTAPANPATGNGTTITAPSITWRTTYDIADHINYAGVQDQPSTSVFSSATYSFAPTLLKPTAYDPFSHMTGAQLSIPNGSTTQAITIARQYDNRGRIVNETDNGEVVTSVSSGSMGSIFLSGTEAGPLSIAAKSGSGVLTVSGSDGYQTVCTTTCNQYTCWQTCNAVPDTGTLAVTIHGFTSSVSYSSGSTDASLAAALTAGFNASGSPVTATASGNSITVTTKATGTASNYPITFSNGDFSVSDPNSTLTGGHNAGSVYDAGTVTATISGGSPAVNITTAPVTWGQGDTPSTLATKLASAINTAVSSYVTATASGSTINLTSNSTGAGVNYAVSVSIIDTQTASYPTLFPSASFTASGSNMTGGAATQSGYGIIYSYLIPQQGGYAPNGNIRAHTDSVMGTWNFWYDPLDRLASAQNTATTPTSTQYANNYGCWSYDAYGNRTLEAMSTTQCANTPLPLMSWASYNPVNNQVASASTAGAGLAYDQAGNVLYDGINNYWYNAEGQLCAVYKTSGSVTMYSYDAEGRRVAKGTLNALPSGGAAYGNVATNGSCGPVPPVTSSTTGFTLGSQYLLDLGGNQATELNTQNGTASVPLGWAHSNVWAGGKLLATYDTLGVHFPLTDPLGTKRIQANAAGAVDETCASLPFGDAQYCTGDDATEHHFTGKERDAESGNDYFGARYYSSAMGRWMSPDPVQYKQNRLFNPQRLNLYQYAINSPLAFIDPTGMDTVIVKFRDLALGAGHFGMISIHKNGTARFGDFGPLGGGKPVWKGTVNNYSLPKVSFGPDGQPTQASWDAIKNTLARNEKQDVDSMGFAYFKTTESDTNNLDTFMEGAFQGQYDWWSEWYMYHIGELPFNVDCRDFLRQGLNAAGKTNFNRVDFLRTPNDLFDNWLFPWSDLPTSSVTIELGPGTVTVPDSVTTVQGPGTVTIPQ